MQEYGVCMFCEVSSQCSVGQASDSMTALT